MAELWSGIRAWGSGRRPTPDHANPRADAGSAPGGQDGQIPGDDARRYADERYPSRKSRAAASKEAVGQTLADYYIRKPDQPDPSHQNRSKAAERQWSGWWWDLTIRSENLTTSLSNLTATEPRSGTGPVAVQCSRRWTRTEHGRHLARGPPTGNGQAHMTMHRSLRNLWRPE